MTDKLHTNLAEWLAQFPEPEPAAKPEVKVPDGAKESAEFFGFDPDALTKGPGNGVGSAVIDGVEVCFWRDDTGYRSHVIHPYRGDIRTSALILASDLRKALKEAQRKQNEREKERVRAAEYANRLRVMQYEITPDIEIGKSRLLSILLHTEGWAIAFCNVIVRDGVTTYCYTLTRD